MWALGIAAMLALLFFTINYANMVRWQVRAQTLADSAAAAGVATDANMNNQVNIDLYAETVDEMRMRYLLQAMLDTVYDRASCASQAACDAALASLQAAYRTASTNYTKVTQDLRNGDNLTRDDKVPYSAIQAAMGDCTVLDCGFTYTTVSVTDQTNQSGAFQGQHQDNWTSRIVEVVACKKVPTIAAAILGLPAASSFKAVGRGASTLAGLAEAFQPGRNNPVTGLPYQPVESPAGLNLSPDLSVDFTGLTVGLTWFVAAPAKLGTLTQTYGCS